VQERVDGFRTIANMDWKHVPLNECVQERGDGFLKITDFNWKLVPLN